MRVCITGASGFIGLNLVEELEARGHMEYVILDRDSWFALPTSAELSPVSRSGIHMEGCDILIHLAGVTAFGNKLTEQQKEQMKRVNSVWPEELARDAALSGVKKIIFLSSIKVNGEKTIANRPFVETDLASPKDVYGHSKLNAENRLWRVAEKFNVELVILRAPLVYGRHCKGNFRLLINLVCSGLPLPFKDLRNLRSMIAVENLVDLIIACCSSNKINSGLYLASDPSPYTLETIIEAIASSRGVKPRLFKCPPSLLRSAFTLLGRTSESERLFNSLVVDGSKISKVLGWQPVATLQQSVKNMVR